MSNMVFVLTVGVIFLILLAAEMLWRRKILKGEEARKFVHILIGVYGAFWPFYLSWPTIQLICILAIGFILLMRFGHIFQSVYDIKRRSWGDLIGPGTFAIVAFFRPNPWIFVAVALHVALADGLAAIIGTRYGKTNKYTVFGQTKSRVGTATFLVVSLLITAWVILLSPAGFVHTAWPVIIWLPLLATIAENFSPYGTDNLAIAFIVLGVLSRLGLGG